MSLDDAEKQEHLRKAETCESLRDELGRDSLENRRFVKDQLADWYIAIAAVCFAIGGFAIANSNDHIVHPLLFWWGSVLLIMNGVLIFFLRKAELEAEDRGFPRLDSAEARLLTLSKIHRSMAAGDSSRKEELVEAERAFASDYQKQTQLPSRWEWVKYVASGCTIDIVFGIFIFALLMLAPQMPNQMHITLRLYTTIVLSFIVLYIGYVIFQMTLFVKYKKLTIEADQRIKKEIAPDSKEEK